MATVVSRGPPPSRRVSFLASKGDPKGKFVNVAKTICLACKVAGIGGSSPQLATATFKVYTSNSGSQMNQDEGTGSPVHPADSVSAGPASVSPVSGGVGGGGHSRSSSGASSHLSLGASMMAGVSPHAGVGANNSRSMSVASVSSDGSAESHLQVEQEDIVVLTHDVRGFKEALGKLRRIFHPEKEKLETMRVSAHERLGEVLRILRSILEKYPPIQSTELLMAAGTLIQQVKTHNYEDEKADPAEFFDAIDQLALAFSSRVSEYLMGDLDSSSHPVPKTKSCENLLSSESENFGKDKLESPTLTPQEIDIKLMQLTDGVDMALSKAKAWSKYAKDVMTYIEKRASLELEHARNLSKLAQTMRPVLKEESFLPFQSIYCTALDQDLENSNHCITTCTLLQGQKFIEPLSNRKLEHEKSRKQIKEIWHREVKRMHDAINNLRKAETMYHQRHQELDKAKESVIRAGSVEGGSETAKLDKKKKLEEEAFQKAIEAETTYKACIIEANQRQQELEKVKGEILQQVRELIYQCDQTMKAVTVGYFQLQHTVSAPAPVQFQTLCESSRLYEPGTQYMEFVRRIPISSMNQSHHAASNYAYYFKPYCSENRLEKDRSSGSNESEEGMAHQLLEGRLSSEGKTPRTSAVKPWSHLQGSDSDSVSSYHSNKSQDTSPTASPRIPTHRPITLSSGDELETDQDSGLGASRRQYVSKAAETHSFRKLKTPSRCRECDSYVYFQGVECTECGLASHRKCLEALAIQCGHKPLPRKMNTFGVSLSAHSPSGEGSGELPDIITRCIREIDERGCAVKGIYRVSGVKSRVEKLCQSFENGVELIDLSDVHPSIIANVLKLYLRQLPEPLLTFKLYNDFVKIAKDYPGDMEKAVPDLQNLVKRLPTMHYKTLAYLMHHLKKLSENCELNHMPPSNLGIVFGPTLLRTSEGSASLSSLVDTVHQTRVIEMLISLAYKVFGQPKESEKTKRIRISQLGPEEQTVSAPNISDCYLAPDCGKEKDVASLVQTSDKWRDSEEDILHQEDVVFRKLPLKACQSDPVKVPPSDQHPVPPPRKNANAPSSSSTENMMTRESAVSSPIQQESDLYTSTYQVTLTAHDELSQIQSGSSSKMPLVKNVAELRRQFFESPPQVFKSDSLSQFVSSPSSTEAEYVPSSDSGSSLAAGSEGSSETDLKMNYRMSISPKPGLELSSSRSTVSDQSSSDLSCTASPLTSSISHLGLNSILRPFSATLTTSTPSVPKRYDGKYQTSLQQRESECLSSRRSRDESFTEPLETTEITETLVHRSKSVEYDSTSTTAISSQSSREEIMGNLQQQQPTRDELNSQTVWEQQQQQQHHRVASSSIQINQSSSSSSERTIREISIQQLNRPLTPGGDGKRKTDVTSPRNPEFV